jgi:general secretion pathway protein J
MTPAARSTGPTGRGRLSGGFTLIELLVALTLVGLLSVVLIGGLRFGTRVWETGGAHGEALAEIEAVQGLLRRQIAQAAVLRPARGATLEERSMTGGPASLRFTAPLPAYVGVGGLYRFELAAVETEAGQGLELVWQLYRPNREDWFEEIEEVSRRTLVDGIESLEFRYFGALKPGEDPSWGESWEEQDRLPALVAVDIGFAEGDRRRWPPLITAPAAADMPAR